MFHLLLSLQLMMMPIGYNGEVPSSIYDFKVPGLTGDTIDFSAFKGKWILVVNTASKCGFTPQFDGLEKLYEQDKDRLVVVGFPSNNVLWQDPGSADRIHDFCLKNYGVQFPMAAKVNVRGLHKAPLYRWLTRKRHNGFEDSRVKWNFQKYLISPQGKLVAVFRSAVAPDDEAITSFFNK
jgi:glutathione peroxidase